MKKLILTLVGLLVIISAVGLLFANPTSEEKDKKQAVIEANVWKTEDGVKHFICPVMKAQGVVSEKSLYSEIDGKRYYHCCAGCSEKFTAETEKYLKDFTIPANVFKVDEDGQHFKCPVKGETGIVSDKTVFTDVDGKRYYFCCSGCKAKFEKNPEKFTRTEEK
ncbi:MAG: YHS domain-containing protein [bacterium]|nr:YHS domain-containing protein [bacterium]